MSDREVATRRARAAADDRVHCLLEVSRHLVSTFDLEAILQATTDAAARLAGLDTAAVYLCAERRLRLWATTPPLPPAFPEQFRDAPIDDHPHLRAAIETRTPIALHDALAVELTPAERAVMTARNIRTLLFVPLVAGGTSTGALIVGSVDEPKPVASADIDLVFTLGNLVALAVENARLFHASETHVAELQQTLADRARAERERLEMERRMLHAQRLESLGVLAGGIAHDFNNLLQAIRGNLDLALRKLPANAPANAELAHCVSAAGRAADLTRQMLAYAGQGYFEVEPVDLNAMVRANIGLLRSSVPRTIDITLALDESVRTIEADAGQLQQVVMNLITNAAEAIGERPGTITIRTGEAQRDELDLRRSLTTDVASSERYVMLEVADTGCGMDAATRARIFDPFFSTKGPGRGLGMAAMMGIVRTHQGAIFVDSDKGRGTTVRVLLPTEPATHAALSTGDAQPSVVGDVPPLRGTVLVADDEAMVLAVCQQALESEGLHVLTATDGREAVEVFRRHADEIRCVILDQTMPNLDGISAAHEIAAIRPDMRVLLTSGFTERDVTQSADSKLAGFLQKPYTIDQLVEALRNAIED